MIYVRAFKYYIDYGCKNNIPEYKIRFCIKILYYLQHDAKYEPMLLKFLEEEGRFDLIIIYNKYVIEAYRKSINCEADEIFNGGYFELLGKIEDKYFND